MKTRRTTNLTVQPSASQRRTERRPHRNTHRWLVGHADWLGFFVLLALMSIVRFFTLKPDLPDYSIDENELVETAVGMLGGDLDHRLHAYGPLLMYLLAPLYALLAMARGMELEDYARRIFFQPTEFYLVARVLSASLVTLMIVTLLVQGRRLFGTSAALFGASLLSLPLIENLTNFTARVDVIQALFQTLALFAILRIAERDRLSDYIAAGVWTGLSFSAKPMPGLLILPMIILARWLVAASDDKPGPQKSLAPLAKHLISRLRIALVSTKLLYAIIALCLVSAITSPYFVPRFQDFLDFQRFAINVNTGGSWLRGYRVDRFISYLGWPLCLLFLASVLTALSRGDRKLRLLIAFPLFYAAAFSLFPTKRYHYPAVIPALCMASGVLLDQLLTRVSLPRLVRVSSVILGMTVLALSPCLRAWPRVERALFVEDYSRHSASLSALRWIEENLPSGTGIFLYGWYPYGPRILHQEINRQARMGEYFMYRRKENVFLRQRFREAHSEVVRSGRPTYNIHYRRVHPRPASRRATLLSHGLASYCRKNGLRYIILSGKTGKRRPHSEFHLPWYEEVSRVAHFRDDLRGNEISIFEVSPDPQG